MKKLLALFLGAVLALSLMPAAFAEGELPGTITLVDDGTINSCTYEGDSTAVKFGNYGTVSANPDGGGNVLKLDMSTWTSGDVNQWWDAKFVNGEKNYFTYDIYLPNDLVNDKSDSSVSLFSPALSTYTDWNDTLGWKMNDNAAGLFYYSRSTTDEGWCYFALKGTGTYTPYTVSAKKWYRVIYEIAADGTSYTAYIQNLTDGGEIAKLHEPISIGFTGIARLQLTSGSFNKNIPVCIDNVSVYSKPVENSMSVTSFGTESGLAASINLTEEADSAAVYVGDTKIAEISDVVGGAYTLSAPWSSLGVTALETCNITLNCYDAEGNVIDTLKVSKAPSVEIKQSIAIAEGQDTFTQTLDGTKTAFTGASPNVNEKGIVEYTYEFKIDKIKDFYLQANLYDDNGNAGYASADTRYYIVRSDGIINIGSENGNAVNSAKWYRVKARLNSVDKTVQYWFANEGEDFKAAADYSGVISTASRPYYMGLSAMVFTCSFQDGVSEENPATFNVRNTTVSRIYSISDIDREFLSTGTVSVAMELGTIAFDEGLAESVIIKKDGAVLTKGSDADVLVIYNTDANTLSITPKDGFAPNSKYTVEIPATASIGGATNVLSLPIVKEYLVLGEDNIYIGDIKISSDNDKYYGSFEYYNGSGADKTVAVLLVSYAGNKVNAVNLESSVKLVNGENDEITVSVPKKDGDTSTRAFIWESVASMMPIAASK